MKDFIRGLIILAYIVLIGAMIINDNYFVFNEKWMFLLNIVLLSIGFYHFVNDNKK